MTTTNDDQPTTEAPGGRALDPHEARVRSTTEAIELELAELPAEGPEAASATALV